jgi:hypothetical protein
MSHDFCHRPAAGAGSTPHLFFCQASDRLEEPCAGAIQVVADVLFSAV